MEMALLAKPYYERPMEWLCLPDATMNRRNSCQDLEVPINIAQISAYTLRMNLKEGFRQSGEEIIIKNLKKSLQFLYFE